MAPRIETGIITFPGDWSGVFIRGDHAAMLANELRNIGIESEAEASEGTPQHLLAVLDQLNCRPKSSAPDRLGSTRGDERAVGGGKLANPISPGRQMIDMDKEDLIQLGAVPNLPWIPLRRGGARLNKRTLRTWAKNGMKGVRLETIMVGGIRYTTERAVREFFDNTQPGGGNRTDRLTPYQASRAHQLAKARLKKMGI